MLPARYSSPVARAAASASRAVRAASPNRPCTAYTPARVFSAIGSRRWVTLYLYDEVDPWALKELGLHAALVTGAGRNQTTLPNLRKDLGSVLTAFSPRSKERPDEFAGEGELDLLIVTDCISEAQNLQDCDYLINYDIHWNPVRIIQRFGRIDRIGSPNQRIQLVNWAKPWRPSSAKRKSAPSPACSRPAAPAP